MVGFFDSSTSSSHSIKPHDLDKILRQAKYLQPTEREYVKGLVTSYKSGGITRREVDKAVRQLKQDTGDHIDRKEAMEVHKLLMDHLDHHDKNSH